MPKKNKRNKTEKKRKELSTADILKLIKKLKPKNQQIVKVNVGDSDKKKKKAGEVQTSYNPPFVFPPQGYSAITSLGQPPYQPPLIEAPRQAASWSSQPVKEPKLLMAPPPSRVQSQPQITDISESEFSEIEPRKKKNSKQGYSVRQPREPIITRSTAEREFNQPKIMNPSNLYSVSSQPTFFNLPVQNDKYKPDIINTDFIGDQIGTLSAPAPSDLWTGTPQGEIEITPEQIQEIQQENETISPEDVFLEEGQPIIEEPIIEEPIITPPEEEEEIVIKKKKKVITTEPLKPIKEPSQFQKAQLGSLYMIDAINKAIREDGFPIDEIPKQYLSSKGISKGFVKTAIKGYEVVPIYEKMVEFKKNKK